MGISQSNNRRRNHNWNAYYSYPSSSYSYYSSDPPYHPHPHPPPLFPFPPHLLPPPPPPSYSYPSTCHCTNPVVGRSVFTPYHNNDWSGSYLPPPPPVVMGMMTPSPYVETQQAKKVKSGLNVHKDSLKLELDEQNPDHHLVSFVFDALFDGKWCFHGVFDLGDHAIKVYSLNSSTESRDGSLDFRWNRRGCRNSLAKRSLEGNGKVPLENCRI